MSEPLLFLDGKVTLRAGDCSEVIKAIADNSIDACITDPPYALVSIAKRFGPAANGHVSTEPKAGATGVYARAARGFMGKAWDNGSTAFSVDFWTEVWRVLKPGAHVVAFGGTRTYHRLACAIEDAGFECRDAVMWHYGTGFPKSHDVSKGIDRAAGAEREVVGRRTDRAATPKYDMRGGRLIGGESGAIDCSAITAPATDAARAWEGWGTALKPATEIIFVGRKPLSEATVAANALRWGTGAINIDACRIHADDAQGGSYTVKRLKPGATLNKTGGNWRPEDGGEIFCGEMKAGRWPANCVHDGSPEVLAAFPESAGQQGKTSGEEPSDAAGKYGIYGRMARVEGAEPRNDSGSAARFFFSAKADALDRAGSKHPTVKPVALLQWLCRLVCPPNGMILDCFAGTGTTGAAAWREGFNAILIEREAEYQADIARRMKLELSGPDERAREGIKAKLKGKPVDHGPLFAEVSV